MKKLMICGLIAGQALLGAQPASAAGMVSGAEHEIGAFGGIRLRVPLDGKAGERRASIGLTLAPTARTESLRGPSRTRIGEGLELGLAGAGPAQLSIAGTQLSRFVQGGESPRGSRAGVADVPRLRGDPGARIGRRAVGGDARDIRGAAATEGGGRWAGRASRRPAARR